MQVKDYLIKAVEQKASDLFILAGSPIMKKQDGHMAPMGTESLQQEETKRLITQLYSMADRDMDRYERTGDDDFSFAIVGVARFRVNAYRQRGSFAAVIRVVAFEIPDWKELHISEEVMKLADVANGMILVTGTAGSGKTTTQACIIDRINRTKEAHVVTLEDPIEYLHTHKKSIISQREVAIDTEDYLSALRACLRQAPDVILMGEMRDAETIHTAITAAETGHLVIATLHTKGTVNAIDRILDAFPSAQQGQMRVQLSMVLKTVVSQQLVPDVNGLLCPAYEIMHVDHAIRTMIRENKNHQINNAISAGGAAGMITMDQYLLELFRENRISRQVLLDYCDNRELLEKKIP